MISHLVHLALWSYVVLLGILVGGALFEFRVLVRVWGASLPESVRAWNSDPRTALDPPKRFFMIVSPAVFLLAIINLYIAIRISGSAQVWLMTSTCMVIAALIATAAYYAPVLLALTMRRGEGMDDATIVRKARLWIALQYIRLAVIFLAWIAALRVFHWVI